MHDQRPDRPAEPCADGTPSVDGEAGAAGRRASKGVYNLVPHPTAAPLPGQAFVLPSAGDAADALAADMLAQAHACVRTFGDVHVALSGGSTPVTLYRSLMLDPRFRDFPWPRTHLWIVDERVVPLDDERSNYRMIAEILVEHSDIPRSQVHPYAVDDAHADVKYENLLRETLEWREKGHDRLDVVLLGMGGDAHTASLFPHSPALHPDEDDDGRLKRLVVFNDGPNVTPPPRLTMTYHLINSARFVGVLVTGDGKRGALSRVSAAHTGQSSETADDLPILGVQPVGGALRWYLDHDACEPVETPRNDNAG